MTLERIKTLSKREHLLLIGSELERARIWQGEDSEKFRMALEYGLEFLNLILQDSKWESEIDMLFGLKEEMQKFYSGEYQKSIEILYQAL